MRLNLHGAAQTVIGSVRLLEVIGSKLVLDRGLYPGRRDQSNSRNRDYGHDPLGVDAVVLFQAHIDHSGNLPNPIRHGFNGPVIEGAPLPI